MCIRDRYIIENKQDINKTNDTRGILKNFFSEYGLFIIVIVVMIAGTKMCIRDRDIPYRKVVRFHVDYVVDRLEV